MLSFPNMGENKQNVGIGLGSVSMILVVLSLANGGMTETSADNDILEIHNELDNHVNSEAHPVATEKIAQIATKLHEIEKEMEDAEKQQKITNKELVQLNLKFTQELNDIKLILCSNPGFICPVHLNS